MFKNILISVDESDCAKRAAELGLAFAHKIGAKAALVHVLQTPPRAFGISVKPDTMQRYGEEVLKPWKQQATAEHQTVSLHLPHGVDVAETIVHTAKELGSDLIVIGTHGREGLGRMFLGSVAERVSRTAAIPVMLVRNDGNQKPELFKRILAPIDGSETSKLALQFADGFAAQLGAELQLVYVIPEIPMPVLYPLGGAVPFPSYEETYLALEEDAKKTMDEALQGCKSPQVSHQIVRANQNRIANVIIDFAKTNHSDLIVLGTHGRTGFDYLLLGSVAEGVSHHATVPVLLIRATQVPKPQNPDHRPLITTL